MRPNTSTRHRGFTIIELLVVITVITLMMTLLLGASYRFVVGARESATAATVMKANGIIQDRVRAFHEFDFSDAAIAYQIANPLAVGNDVVLAEVLLRKVRFKKAFPQALSELDASQIARFFPSGNTVPTGTKYETGVILYALLMKGETFGAATPADDAFTGAEVKNNSDTGNLPCLVDAWGEPIRFYRWPTRLIRAAEQGYQIGDAGTAYDDYNQNGQQDAGGYECAAARPSSLFPGPSPASVLIASLPPYERTSSYALGPDGHPGVALVDDDGNGTVDDASEIGWPVTDDPELLDIDPDDPTFRLAGYASTSAQRIAFATNPTLVLNPGLPPGVPLHDLFTFHTPLIVSAGQDKQLGLYEPTDFSATCGHLAAPTIAPSSKTAYATTMQNLFDNISNLNQKPGGK